VENDLSRLLDEMSRAERRRRELADEEARLAQAAADAARNEREAERRGVVRSVPACSAVERAWQHAGCGHGTSGEARGEPQEPSQIEDHGADEARADEGHYEDGTQELRARADYDEAADDPRARGAYDEEAEGWRDRADHEAGADSRYGGEEIKPYAPQAARRRWSGPARLAALAVVLAIGAAIWAGTRTPEPAGAGGEQRSPAGVLAGEPVGSGFYVVEVGSVRDSAQAAALQQKVAHAGLRGHSERVRADGSDMIRVQAGPYVTAELAHAARERLSAAGLSAQVVLR
jgi:hypothetical protein